MNTMPVGLDVRAWVVWVFAGTVAAMLARNPVYLAIILLAVRLVHNRCARPEQTISLPFGRLAILVLSLSTLVNVAFVHIGETVFWQIPAGWPLIGGPLTLEAAVAGLINGLVILALLAVFLAFNAAVPAGDLMRLVPRAFHDLSVVLLIALTYVPETTRHWQSIREAQAVRGHRLRGWQDLRPLVVPLFVGGLERAFTLSESLVARGFNAPAGRPLPNWRRGLILGLLVLALLGWALALWRGWPGWFIMGAAVITTGILLWQTGRRIPRTHYRPNEWKFQDTLLVSISLVVLLVVILAAGTNQQYSPYPQLSLPSFQLFIGITLTMLAYPALAAHHSEITW